MATSTRSKTALVTAAIDAVSAKDADALRQSWAPDVVERFPDRTCNGRDELLAYFESVWAAFPDFRIEILHTAEEGDSVFVRHEISGTHTGGPFAGIEATGKPVRIPGIDHFTVKDGRIVSNFVVFDGMDMGRQLGLMPPDGSAPDKALKAAFNGVARLRKRLGR